MSWTIIRPQIATLLESVSKMQEVHSFPTLKFDGFPSCYVIPSDVEADYETNTENERFYSFVVRVFYETKNTGVTDALTNLESAVDDIIDAFDREDKVTGADRTIATGLPAKYTYLSVSAVPSVWGELPTENLIMAEIRVRVRVSFDATS